VADRAPTQLRGTGITAALRIVEYDPGAGTGHVVIEATGGSWWLLPEVGDEIASVRIEATGRFQVRADRTAGYWLQLTSIEGDAYFTTFLGGKESVEAARILLTVPGERGFYIDDIIVGATTTTTGVRGLLLPAVQ
jgi:hypothetical protein